MGCSPCVYVGGVCSRRPLTHRQRGGRQHAHAYGHRKLYRVVRQLAAPQQRPQAQAQLFEAEDGAYYGDGGAHFLKGVHSKQCRFSDRPKVRPHAAHPRRQSQNRTQKDAQEESNVFRIAHHIIIIFFSRTVPACQRASYHAQGGVTAGVSSSSSSCMSSSFGPSIIPRFS